MSHEQESCRWLLALSPLILGLSRASLPTVPLRSGLAFCTPHPRLLVHYSRRLLFVTAIVKTMQTFRRTTGEKAPVLHLPAAQSRAPSAAKLPPPGYHSYSHVRNLKFRLSTTSSWKLWGWPAHLSPRARTRQKTSGGIPSSPPRPTPPSHNYSPHHQEGNRAWWSCLFGFYVEHLRQGLLSHLSFFKPGRSPPTWHLFRATAMKATQIGQWNKGRVNIHYSQFKF